MPLHLEKLTSLILLLSLRELEILPSDSHKERYWRQSLQWTLAPSPIPRSPLFVPKHTRSKSACGWNTHASKHYCSLTASLATQRKYNLFARCDITGCLFEKKTHLCKEIVQQESCWCTVAIIYNLQQMRFQRIPDDCGNLYLQCSGTFVYLFNENENLVFNIDRTN